MKCAIQFPESVLLSRVDDELVLLDTQQGIYYGLNDMGCRMVSLLKELRDFDAVIEILSREYDAPQDQISADLQTLIDDLAAKGLVHVET